MTDDKLKPTQADYALAEEVTSAANIVTVDGYYEVDTDAVAAAIARHRIAATDTQVSSLVSAGQAALSALTAETIGTVDMDDPDWYELVHGAVTELRAALDGMGSKSDA